MELYLDLKKTNLESTFKKATKDSLERDGDESKDGLLYDDLQLDVDVKEYPCYNEKDNTLDISGDIKTSDGKELGFLSLNIDLDFDLVLSIIESYRKRLGKLKTVLEATKD